MSHSAEPVVVNFITWAYTRQAASKPGQKNTAADQETIRLPDRTQSPQYFGQPLCVSCWRFACENYICRGWTASVDVPRLHPCVSAAKTSRAFYLSIVPNTEKVWKADCAMARIGKKDK